MDRPVLAESPVQYGENNVNAIEDAHARARLKDHQSPGGRISWEYDRRTGLDFGKCPPGYLQLFRIDLGQHPATVSRDSDRDDLVLLRV